MSQASPVSICSNALQLLGDKPIASFEDGTVGAGRSANLWPTVRDALLRAHPWNCATRRVLLAPLATAPVFDFAHKFLLPGDWLKTVQVGRKGFAPPFRSEGRAILANINPLPLVYIFRNEDPATWDSALVHVAELKMAAALAYPITTSTSLRESMAQEAEFELRRTKAQDEARTTPKSSRVAADAGAFLRPDHAARLHRPDQLHCRRARPDVWGRVDVARYQSSAKLLRNCIVDIYGGVRRALVPPSSARPGIVRTSAAWFPSSTTERRPTTSSSPMGKSASSAPEAGIILAGGVPYEIDSPYISEDLPSLRYAEGRRHDVPSAPDYPIPTLRRLGRIAGASSRRRSRCCPSMRWAPGSPPCSPCPTRPQARLGRSRPAQPPSWPRTLAGESPTRRVRPQLRRSVAPRASPPTSTPSSTRRAARLRMKYWPTSPRATLTPSAAVKMRADGHPTLGSAGWRSADVGKYVKVNGGLASAHRLHQHHIR